MSLCVFATCLLQYRLRVAALYCTLLCYRSVCLSVCVAKLVPLAYGIKKLQIACVVEDDKVDFVLVYCTNLQGSVRWRLLRKVVKTFGR